MSDVSIEIVEDLRAQIKELRERNEQLVSAIQKALDRNGHCKVVSKRKTSTKAAPTPEIKVVIDYFSDQYSDKFGSRPLLGGKDAALVKARLKSFTADGLKSAIDFFLNSPKATDHPTLSTAMSEHSLNLWEQKVK